MLDKLLHDHAHDDSCTCRGTHTEEPMLAPSFKKVQTQRDALTLLIECGSHAAFNREEADAIAKPFGFVPRLHVEKANTDPKGYIDPSLKRGEKVYMTGGWILASQIAAHLSLQYEEHFFGRGRLFHAAVDAIEAHINKEGAAK